MNNITAAIALLDKLARVRNGFIAAGVFGPARDLEPQITALVTALRHRIEAGEQQHELTAAQADALRAQIASTAQPRNITSAYTVEDYADWSMLVRHGDIAADDQDEIDSLANSRLSAHA